MKNYFLYDQDGEIKSWGICQDDDFDLQERDGFQLAEGIASPETHYVKDGVLTEYTESQAQEKRERPYFATWSNATMLAIDGRPIEAIRAGKNAEINAARLIANQSYFEFEGKHIAVDPLSRSDIDAINGIVSLTGFMPDGWFGFWKALDNSYIPIPDKDAWTEFYSAMVAQGSANFAKSQTLKTVIQSATTAEELEAIKWD